jgi:hypothetical protein
MMNKTYLILGVVLSNTLIFLLFTREIQAVISIAVMSTFAAALTAVILHFDGSLDDIWKEIKRIIDKIKYWIQKIKDL